jgi:hypothetical protein
MSSLTLHANLFHEFQPIGGVGARFADRETLCCPVTEGTKSNTLKNMGRRARVSFMQTFYQKRLQIDIER